ncbi:MAG: T9SS type A sorting domain-containing protein [candidate division KSB1 bacterium]|nr:T9SS type A sorting domain-containing protein [candidate division KSB1 bacterium]MDZ7368253.1 T9SS type A sorting domain-containing protein [candidate division KSB1 bacterium]MDZ7406765.1 T9SS type A sorting domain-containing protein [candidate division KSB1 bacterium]
MNTVVKRSCLILLLMSLLALPALAQNARVQFIHNSGDIDARPIDLYVGDSLYVDQFTYRTATPFRNVPSGSVKILLTHPTRKDSIVADVNLDLAAGGTYVCIINGILKINLNKYANPDPANRNIQISVFAAPNARETASNSAKVEFFVNNGNTDGPIGGLDFFTVGSTTPFVDNLGYSQSTTSYISIDPGKYTYDVKEGNDNTKLLGSYEGDFTADAGKSAVVLASGFVNPAANQGSQKLGLIAVFADGTVKTFRTIEILPAGKWKLVASPYKFTDFIGADTLVNGGHGIAVDRRNRIWIGNFNAAGRLRVIKPDGTPDPISPIQFVKVGTDSVNTSNCRGMTLDKDGSILFVRFTRLYRLDPATGKALKVFIAPGSLLSPMVDKDSFIWTGRVSGINPIDVIDPNSFASSQQINLKSPPGFGRGIGITADARKIFTPDLGSSGGPLYIWTTTDFINYTKTDSIYTNDKGELIMRTNRQTMNWHPKDSTLWVSVDRASTPVNNADNGLYVFDFKKFEYFVVAMPEIKNAAGTVLGNGPRNVAFSVSGDTAFAVSFDGSRLMRFVKGAVGVKDKPFTRVPGTYELFQNYPNPFNPNTTIAYTLSHYAVVELKVYDSLGREVKTLVHKVMPPGRHETTFDAAGLASGLYYYRLYVDGQVFTKSMMLLK